MAAEIPRDLIRFKENMDKISELVNESFDIIGELPIDDVSHLQDRAKSYWYPHIELEIYDCTRWVGSSMCTMEETLRDLLELSGIKFKEEDEIGDIFRPPMPKKKITKKGRLSGHTVYFEGATETVEEIFGTEEMAPSEMIEKVWKYVKNTNRLI